MSHESVRKIVFVCASSSAFIGHHFALAKEAARSMEVHVVLNMDDPSHSVALGVDGIIVHSVPLSRKSVNPFRVLKEALAVRSMLLRLKPDVVNSINLKSVLVVAIARMGLRCSMVGTVTGLGYMFAGDSLSRKLLRKLTVTALRWALPHGRHVLVYSNEDDRREFLSYGVGTRSLSRIVRVPGVDADEYAWSPEPEKGFRVLLPARMLVDKGVEVFVEAARLVKKRIPEAEFLLAGGVDSGNPSGIGSATLMDWSREGVVSWLDYCDDMPSLLASVHVVCLPSVYREGFPRVLAEAMACGRAIVTTDMPGCRDAVCESSGGLVVPPRDSMALADALIYLYVHPEHRRHMASAGREWVLSSVSLSGVTSEMMNIFGWIACGNDNYAG